MTCLETICPPDFSEAGANIKKINNLVAGIHYANQKHNTPYRQSVTLHILAADPPIIKKSHPGNLSFPVQRVIQERERRVNKA
jgi:hypothetical protein